MPAVSCGFLQRDCRSSLPKLVSLHGRGAGRGRGGLSPSFHAPRAQAKRCIESDRPVDDFSALWEQMRLAYAHGVDRLWGAGPARVGQG
mgnify:CR=1 FL=1